MSDSFRMNKTGQYRYLIYLLVFTVFGGCRKELVYDHSKEVDLHLKLTYSFDWHLPWDENWNDNWPANWIVDWDKMLPKVPGGVRLHVFDSDAGTPLSNHNLNQDGGKVAINGGQYDMLLYNNDTEGIVFENMHAVHEAVATTRATTRSASYSKKYPDEITATPPDILFAAYLPETELKKPKDGETVYKEISVKLVPRTWTYLIRYEFTSGKEYVSEARGYLSGMAGSVSLKDGYSEADKIITLLLDCHTSDYGMESIGRSFGLPGSDLQTTDPGVNKLVLEMKLLSGKIKMAEFDVTEQVRRQPRGGVIVVKGIVVTPEEGQKPGGSGFDGDVNDWEENEDVEVPIT